MQDETKLWEIERDFWLGGPEFFEAQMAPDCLMVFPDPVGILSGPDIPDTLREVPRWSTIAMNDQKSAVTGDTTVLVYRAEAKREGQAPYRALCSSTYVTGENGPRLVQHQQTPLE